MAYSVEIERLVGYKHKLEAENRRLREALAAIAEMYPNMCPDITEIARAALDGSNQ